MKNEKPYSHPRWYAPMGGKAAEVSEGPHKEMTEEEKKQDEEFVRKFKEAMADGSLFKNNPRDNY